MFENVRPEPRRLRRDGLAQLEWKGHLGCELQHSQPQPEGP